MNKFKISHLKAMKKADIYSLCLKEFGSDTATIYQHYTKAEMIDDLMSVTMDENESVATPAEVVAEPTKTIQIELPFMGFYESYHVEQPHEIMERVLDDKAETITDKENFDLWRIFNSEFSYKEYCQKTANLYAQWLINSLYDGVEIANVELHSPREYNFTTDTITVTVNATLEQLDLTHDYFTANGLMYETLAYIKNKYTSRDGFISFVKPTPPTLEDVFIDPAYLDCAFELYVYHKLDMDYENDNYRYLLNDLDTKFIDYMHEQGHYDDLFWDCLPKDLADYLNGDTP